MNKIKEFICCIVVLIVAVAMAEECGLEPAPWLKWTIRVLKVLFITSVVYIFLTHIK